MTKTTFYTTLSAAFLTLYLVSGIPAAASSQKQPNSGNSITIDSDKLAWIDEASEIFFSNEQLPSLVTIVVHDGSVVHRQALGVLDRISNEPVETKSIYQSASIAKVFTGIITRQLIIEGKLSTEAPITDYLPQTLSPQTSEKLKRVSVVDLLHHKSGFPRDSKVATREGNDPLLTPLSEKGLLRDLDMLALEAEPGEKFEYSNLGYATLGYILERASGEHYADLLERIVKIPYGMNDTDTRLASKDRCRLVQPYRKENRFQQTSPWNTGKLAPASALYTTAEDLARLMIKQIYAYRNLSGTPESSELISSENQTTVRELTEYGYGVWITPLTFQGKSYEVIAHNGDMDGYAGTYMFVPALNFGIITVTSSGGRWAEIHQSFILRKLADRDVALPRRNKNAEK